MATERIRTGYKEVDILPSAARTVSGVSDEFFVNNYNELDGMIRATADTALTSLDVDIQSYNQTLRDRIKDKVSEFIEQKDIWTDMWAVNEYQDEAEQWILFIRVPFFTALKRDAFRDKIKSEAQKVWSKCEAGSYIALHDCDHDENDRQGCKIRRILEK